MNKKADEKLVMNKLIVIILCILVLLAILMFIFKVNILEWIRNLPDYTYEGDKEIDYTKLSPDVLLQLGCTEKIALIGDKDVKIFGDRREFFMFIEDNKLRKIELYVDVNDPDHYFIRFIEGKDMDVGEVKDKVLTINKNILDNYDPDDRFGKKVSLADLEKMNGAHLILTRLLCKTKEEVRKAPIKRTILGKEVDLVLDDGEERCKAVEVSDNSFNWLKNYGLKNGNLEYFENNEWKNVEDEIPNEEEIILKERKTDLTNKKNKLKINYANRDYELLLDSQRGIYFFISGADEYLLTKEGASIRVVKYTYEGKYVDLTTDIEQNLIKAFQDALVKESLDLDVSNGRYYLFENLVSPFYIPDVYYALDDLNLFYKSTSADAGKIWMKYEESKHNYLYVDDTFWEHMKQRARIKEDLEKACK